MIRPGRIFIVDDLEEWREELKEVLTNTGFEVETASTTSEGLKRLQEGLFHILILDIRLQETDQSNNDGILLLEVLKKLGLNEAIKVIMISAHVTIEHTYIVFKEYDVADFVFKLQFNKQKFREQVRQVLAEHVNINLNLDVHWHPGYNWEKAMQELYGEAGNQRSTSFSDQVTAEATDLFCRLFSQAESILARPLAPGHSGASVMRIKPFYENGGGREVVVKFGRVEQIKQEYENYQHYVRPYIGGARNTSVLEMRRTPHLGGIIYSLLGTANDQLEDFGSFYHHASVSQIKEVLERLFRETCGDWYANRGNLQLIDLTADYRRVLRYYSPERLDEIRLDRLPSVEGAHNLTFKSLTGRPTFLNPIRATESLEFVHPTYASITHGDFNPHNLMVDNNGHVWMIDFQETNQSHILRDVATLDAVVRFQLLTAAEATLDERFKLEETLNRVDHFSQLDQLPLNFSSPNSAIAKAYDVVLYLRKQAYRLVQQNPDDDMNEYYVASLYIAMNTLRFSTLSPVQLEHALLCASLLADRLLANQ